MPIPDGYTSATALIKYLERAFPNVDIQWRLHEGKEHGVIVDTVPEDINLVILPDAGSNQYEEHKQLKAKGIDVIVLDHHDCSEESKDAIVVNSQLSPNYPNKHFSGVGVTYKFLQALDDTLNLNFADDYLDLVAIGNIADSMDMRTLETRYYVNKGLKQIKNKLLAALFEKQSFSTKGKINITAASFYINPLINACIRVGSMEEKTQMMNAFLESDEKIYYNYKKKDTWEDIEVNTARLLGNIKARQGRLRDKSLAQINEKIEEKQLLDNKILIVNVTDILDKNLTGLVANSLKDTYKRSTMLLRYNEEKQAFTGSIRGYDKGAIKDFKTFLQNTKQFVFVEGHANAAGFQINPENVMEVNDISNELLKDSEINVNHHEVDFIIPAKQLTSTFIKEISKLQDIWGYQVEEPLIALKNVEVNKDEVYINGTKKNTLKFSYKGIEFIKYFSSESEWESIVNKGERLLMDVVGKCSINEYKGKVTPQIKIDDYEITKTEKKILAF